MRNFALEDILERYYVKKKTKSKAIVNQRNAKKFEMLATKLGQSILIPNDLPPKENDDPEVTIEEELIDLTHSDDEIDVTTGDYGILHLEGSNINIDVGYNVII